MDKNTVNTPRRKPLIQAALHAPMRFTALRGLVALAALLCCTAAGAFAPESYTGTSCLSQGKWVKVSVPQSGLYMLTASQLREWGFTDLSAVRVYGYGGQRIPDLLSADNYIDDLPVVQTVATDRGVVFYGVGPEKWVESTSGYHHRENNIYTNAGYYFVTASADTAVPEIPVSGFSTTTATAVTTYIDRLHYEQDLTSPGEAGYVLVGENFKNQNNRKYTFNMPGRVEGTDVWFECTLVTKSTLSTTVNFMANGAKVEEQPSDKVNSVSASAYIHGGYTQTSHIVRGVSGEKLDLSVSLANLANVQNSWLDYISVNYTRELALPSTGYLDFWSSNPQMRLSATQPDVRVWDVTNPGAVIQINTGGAEGGVKWTNEYIGERTYAAWTPGANLPQPGYAGTVDNQNIHGMDNADMVIFTLPEYMSQARRLAALHASARRPLKVHVLNVEQVYNEFSSGSADVSGLRKCLKMFYDRSVAAPDGPRLGYALLMGRATYDNRHLTSQFSVAGAHGTIPYWMGGSVRLQFSDNDAYGTDDFIAILGDGTGTKLGLDNLDVAVGRMPVTSLGEARNAVDKLVDYCQKSAAGTWKNSFLFLADDGDNGEHLNQVEALIGELVATPDQQNFITKVYIDAYDIVGGVCEGGRQEMYRMLDEGIVWWNFTGHANNHSWTGEGMLTFSDINNLYLKKVPVLFAATCDFLRWDSNTQSGGEILFSERNGGTIATISASRPVYITENGLLSKAMGRSISLRDADGNLPRLGDIYRHAKNNILSDKGEHRSSMNRLRYVLMGDPAMALPTPSNIVHLESIGGEALGGDSQVTLQALQRTTVKGTVRRPDGTVCDGFNGSVMLNLYDAERSITTKGERKDNVKITFEQHGDKLFSGSGRVVDGEFEVNISMPGEITDNFRPALMNMYAYSDSGDEAVGVNTGFYVYGLDENVADDTEAPKIERMALNTETFADGDKVNESPMLLASIRDNVGINLSSAGIGHQMVLVLDGKKTYTDVSLYYTPDIEGTPSGTISYPLENLTEGEHTITLKVWDTAANSASRQITFNVEKGLTPTIFDIYTDANPASTAANFYVKHDRPDSRMTVTLTVYNLLGHPLWQATEVGQSDMFLSAPITWDLCDSSGRRVPRGIYLYRASISTDGEKFETTARKIAVTGTGTAQ